jgi:hypothetical protein
MSQLEHLIALFSIIVGLGLADLVQSLRTLIRPNLSVRWHWLPLAWVLFDLLIVINIWWGAYEQLQHEVWGHPLPFLLVVILALCLYLLCALALPDVEWDEAAHDRTAGNERVLDLEAYYFSDAHRRWFFGTVIALLFIAFVGNVIGGSITGPSIVTSGLVNLGVASIFGVLLVTDRTWVHAILTVLSLVLMALILSRSGGGLS